jgi:N-acetylmuramoyl-L-alanine amidase
MSRRVTRTIFILLCLCAGAPRLEAQLTRFTTIVIDAGHGGYDRGGIPGQRIPEKVMTLDVSQRLKLLLEKAGYRVIMTRDSDVFVPLPTRVAIANSYPNAVFICVHFNSATRSGANGIETYFYSTESAPLAASIQGSVLGGVPSENRGVRRRGYYVLRRTTIPAVLVECGFLTNPTEAQYAQSAAYRQKLAENIARGIRSRPALAARTDFTNRSSHVDVGLQPFYDQRFMRDSSSKHHKGSKSKKRSSSKRKHKSTPSEQ